MKYLKEPLDKVFRERIMLAVTEVNGCDICSYAHTKMALEAGMSSEEINEMLSGGSDSIPDDESIAIMFAQHVAESRGNPSLESFHRVCDYYGKEKAKAILGYCRIMMVANTLGIAFGNLQQRFSGKNNPQSSLWYELQILLPVPFLLVGALISSMIYKDDMEVQ